MFELRLKPGQLSLKQLRRIHAEPVQLSLVPNCLARIEAATETVREVIAQGRVVYGVNTGFGLLANTRIPSAELEQLQRAIVLSHAAGVGKLMDEAVVRLLLVLKISSLARGYSGIRLEVIEDDGSESFAQRYEQLEKDGPTLE